MGTYIGLDLAWTETHETGYCYLAGETASDLRCSRIGAEVKAPVDLADEIAAIEGPVTVAIDAPMLYTDERKVENEISRRFVKEYSVGAHSAHHAVESGWKAGVELGDALRDRGFAVGPDDWRHRERHERVAIEVYPHTIHVQLFGLSERLQYKPKSGVSVDQRRQEMCRYQTLLLGLIGKEAEGLLQSCDIIDTLSRDMSNIKGRALRGQALKRHDDTLDGLTCALAAWLVSDQPEEWETMGDENGYIVVPKCHATSNS